MNSTALNDIFPADYAALHRLAASYIRRERPGHTLEAAALVNEAYLQLATANQTDWNSRQHLLGAASQLMRRILIDHARFRMTAKRGAGATVVAMSEAGEVAGGLCPQSTPVGDALRDLAAFEPRLAKLVELRYLEGLSLEEAAEAMGVSTAWIRRQWTTARTWLAAHLDARPAVTACAA